MRNSGGYVLSVAVTYEGDTLGELRIVLKYPGGRLGGSMCNANCGGVYEAWVDLFCQGRIFIFVALGQVLMLLSVHNQPCSAHLFLRGSM